MAAQPSNTVITIDDMKFNAISAHAAIATIYDNFGLPSMGAVHLKFACAVDVHDTKFRNWVSQFEIAGGEEANPILNFKLAPTLDDKQGCNIWMGN